MSTRKTGALISNPMWNVDAYRMIQRRAKATDLKTRIGCHTFRATGITVYLKNKGILEHAQHIANHESPCTTNTNPLIYPDIKEAFSLPSSARYVTQYIRGGISSRIEGMMRFHSTSEEDFDLKTLGRSNYFVKSQL
jgi:hypothetical protein